MRERVLMAKFREQDGPCYCTCGQYLRDGEVISLYPIPEESDDEVSVREIVCMTCHFWFTHNVLEEMGR